MNRIFYILLVFTFLFLPAKSQNNVQEKFIQVSGIVTDKNSEPVQGVGVISKKLHRITTSERTGIYSITSTPGDTVFYRALGYKRYHTIIPEDFSGKLCMVDIMLEPDTVTLETVTILPWRSYSEFLKDMTRERPVDPIIENMNENLASIYVAVSNQTSVRISPEAGFRYAMEQNFTSMATRNQYPVNNLLNPFAWAKFFSEVKKGLLKNQGSSNKPVPAKVIKKKKKPSK